MRADRTVTSPNKLLSKIPLNIRPFAYHIDTVHVDVEAMRPRREPKSVDYGSGFSLIKPVASVDSVHSSAASRLRARWLLQTRFKAPLPLAYKLSLYSGLAYFHCFSLTNSVYTPASLVTCMEETWTLVGSAYRRLSYHFKD